MRAPCAARWMECIHLWLHELLCSKARMASQESLLPSQNVYALCRMPVTQRAKAAL